MKCKQMKHFSCKYAEKKLLNVTIATGLLIIRLLIIKKDGVIFLLEGFYLFYLHVTLVYGH